MEEMGRAASLQPYVTIVYIGRIHHHSEALLVSQHVLEMTDGDGTKGAVI